MNRRNFLQTTMGATAATILGATKVARAATATPRNLILVYAQGAWDPAFVLDPKPGTTQTDMPAGQMSSYGTDLKVWTDTSRPNVKAFFDAWSGVSAVVNGIAVGSISHMECRQRMLTGTRSETNPDIAAMAAFEQGWDLPAPYLVLGPSAFTGTLASGSTRLGNMNQIVALLDPPAAASGAYAAPAFTPNASQEAAIRAYVESRANRVAAMRGQAGRNQKRVADFLESLGRGDLLRQNASGFGTIGKKLDLAEQRTLAVDMLQANLSISVHLDSTHSWDSHDRWLQEQTSFNDELYGNLKALADDLAARPGRQAGNKMLDETVVMVCSEMGRTPKINGTGKDHWPVTSCLVFGAGIKGGRSLGRSSAGQQAQEIDYATGAASAQGKLLTTDALLSGVLDSMGIDASHFFPASTPFTAIKA